MLQLRKITWGMIFTTLVIAISPLAVSAQATPDPAEQIQPLIPPTIDQLPPTSPQPGTPPEGQAPQQPAPSQTTPVQTETTVLPPEPKTWGEALGDAIGIGLVYFMVKYWIGGGISHIQGISSGRVPFTWLDTEQMFANELIKVQMGPQLRIAFLIWFLALIFVLYRAQWRIGSRREPEDNIYTSFQDGIVAIILVFSVFWVVIGSINAINALAAIIVDERTFAQLLGTLPTDPDLYDFPSAFLGCFLVSGMVLLAWSFYGLYALVDLLILTCCLFAVQWTLRETQPLAKSAALTFVIALVAFPIELGLLSYNASIVADQLNNTGSFDIGIVARSGFTICCALSIAFYAWIRPFVAVAFNWQFWRWRQTGMVSGVSFPLLQMGIQGIRNLPKLRP